QTIRVQRLATKRDRPQVLGPERITPFPDERVTAEPCLDANLIATARDERYLDQRCRLELFDHPVVADRLLAARITRVGLLLDQRLVVPRQPITPRARRRMGMAVNDGPIHALGAVPLELIFQMLAGGRRPGEQHQPRRIAIDAMNDERPRPAPDAEGR